MARTLQSLILGLLVLLILPFGFYALDLGLRGMAGRTDGPAHLFALDRPIATAAIRIHMVFGAVLSVLAALQLIGPVRRHLPSIHRWNGRIVVSAALITGPAGLAYIVWNGTVGGAWMSAGFALYGLLLVLAALQTIRHARARDFDRHRAWALRLFVLAIASWIYRLHYAVWEITTGGFWRAEDFSGAFDRANIWAFYLPYLVLVELWLWLRPRAKVG